MLKRVSVFLTVMLLVLSLAACGGETGTKQVTSEDIVGEWVAEVDLFDLAEDSLCKYMHEDTKFKSSLPATITVEFKKDNQYTILISCDDDDLENFTEDYAEALTEDAVNKALDSGYKSEKEYLDGYKATFGISLEEYNEDRAKKEIDNYIDIWTWLGEKTKGSYNVTDGNIQLRAVEDTTISFTLGEDILTFTKINGQINNSIDSMLEFDSCGLPWKFEKQ